MSRADLVAVLQDTHCMNLYKFFLISWLLSKNFLRTDFQPESDRGRGFWKLPLISSHFYDHSLIILERYWTEITYGALAARKKTRWRWRQDDELYRTEARNWGHAFGNTNKFSRSWWEMVTPRRTKAQRQIKRDGAEAAMFRSWKQKVQGSCPMKFMAELIPGILGSKKFRTLVVIDR